MRYFLCIVIALFSTVARSETLQVKAADHDAFSRVVFYGQSKDDWALLRAKGGYLLRQEGVGFDTSDVFSLMKRDRIADLLETDDGIFLKIDCDCHANAFFLQPNMVVVDINDGPGQDLGIERASLTPQQRAGLQAALSRNTPTTKQVDLDALDAEKELADAVSRAEALLLEQLGRAASQGLASPKDNSVASDSGIVTPMTPRPSATHSDVLSASTSIDFSDSEVEKKARDAMECVPEDWLPSKGWSEGDSFSSGLSVLRSQLSDEMDVITADRKMRLARHYVAHGFTLEALGLVGQNQSKEAAMLKRVVAIIEQSDTAGPWPQTRTDCPGTSAIWQFLTTDPKNVTDELGKEVLKAIPRLPPDLAHVLSRRISEIAYETGEPALVSDISAQLRYLLGKKQPLAQADAVLMSSDTGSDSNALLDIARGDDLKSREALLAYVSGQFLAARPVAADIPDLVDAYAFEAKDTEIGQRLDRAKLMVSALSGDFGTAFDGMADLQDDIELVNGAYALLVANASDVQFLRLIAKDNPDIDPDLKRRIASRLISLGFVDLALQWLPNDMNPETRLLRARVFSEAGRLQDAMTELAGQTGEEVSALRARLHLKQSAFAAASNEFASIEMADPALRAAFLANDPALIAQHWVSDQSDALVEPISLSSDPQVSLAQGRSLIEMTKRKSASLKAALGEFSAP